MESLKNNEKHLKFLEVEKTLEKYQNFVSPEKWQPCEKLFFLFVLFFKILSCHTASQDAPQEASPDQQTLRSRVQEGIDAIMAVVQNVMDSLNSLTGNSVYNIINRSYVNSPSVSFSV